MGAEKRNLEYLSPDDLIPYANNAKKHPKDQVLRISKSIKEFGFNAPVIIDSKNNIVAGHGRILAAKKLKLETVPCVRVDHLTEKQKKAYILADNRLTELGEWDLEILNTELQDIEYDLDIIGFDGWKVESHLKGLTDEDECPEIPKTPKSKLGDVWILGDHRLMCGDSTDRAAVEKLMLGLKADLLLTDPPYNLAYEGKTKEALKIQNDHMSAAAFKEFLTTVFRNADAVMKKGAAFYIWFADVETLSFCASIDAVDWTLRQMLIWIKNTLVMGRKDYHFKHEPCLYGWKPGAAHYWAGDRKQTTLLEFDRPARSAEHPTMKPVALIEYQMLNSTKDGGVVLDLFAGSGSMVIAAEKNGRRAMAMELDPKYCDVVVKRWEDYTGKRAEKING